MDIQIKREVSATSNLGLQPYKACDPPEVANPRVEALVNELIGRIADKWTMLILEVLIEKGELRFTRLSEHVTGISYKMLTQTLRHMERMGLIKRTVHPVVPPKVEYKLTELGISLGGAFCGVWLWAEQNLEAVEKARLTFDQEAYFQHRRRSNQALKCSLPTHGGKAQQNGVLNDDLDLAYLVFLLIGMAAWWFAVPQLARMVISLEGNGANSAEPSSCVCDCC